MLIDPLNMDAADPAPLAENLQRLREAFRERFATIEERETLAAMSALLAVVNRIMDAPAASSFRGGYRSLYVLATDGVTSTRATEERRNAYALAVSILEGNES